jgi:ELWxxDGT repeat protein
MWDDRNGNGVLDAGEPALTGWTIYLDQNLNGQLDVSETSTTTDANGNYAFTGLAAGTYTVAMVPQSGWMRTSPSANSASRNTLISVTDRRDLIFDSGRNRLYMTTSDGQIERYDVATRTLLTPWQVGNSLYGGDITTDGSALYVAEGQSGATQAFVRKVNLNDGSFKNLTFNLNYDDTPIDVSITSNGLGLIRSRGQWGQIRQIDLSTDTITNATGSWSYYGGSQITRSADRSLFFATEDGISSGNVFTYDASTKTFSSNKSTNTYLGSNLSAVNRNGSLIALEWGNGISIMDRNLNGVENLSGVDGGMVFDPVKDILYAASTTTDQIIAFNTNNWQELYRLNIGEDIKNDYDNSSRPFGNGMMAVSNDGQYLFMSTSSGVRMLNLTRPGTYTLNLSAGQVVENINFGANAVPVLSTNTGLSLNEGATASITSSLLQVTDTDSSAAQLTYTLSNLPTNGILRLNGTALSSGQTLTQDDINNSRVSYQHNGSETTIDSLSFTVSDGAGNTLSSNNFSITINPVNDAPVLAINRGRSLRQGGTVTINSASLQTTDPDNTPTQLTYALGDVPIHGTLRLSGTALSAGQTFTQEDINSSRLSYQHDGSAATSDSFSFTVTDGSITLNSSSFNLAIASVSGLPSLVRDINPGSGSSLATNLTNINGTLYFAANDGINGTELWKSDGTATGTVLVKDIYAGSNFSGQNSSSPSNFTNVNGTVYFTATDGVNGTELWKTDGTAAGTVLVKDINSGVNSSSPANLININGILYFTASNSTTGTELWKSDGTAAGTVLVKDILAGTGTSSPANFTNVNGTLYFTANDGTNGFGLWKSDGTAAGTVLVKQLNPQSLGSSPANLTTINGTLYFPAYDPDYGYELWKTDGTEAGTVLVKDIYAGAGGSVPTQLTNVNGTLYFTAYDGVNGYGLWKSDGTTGGTQLVKVIHPEVGGSSPVKLTNVNGTLYFIAYNGANGYELWKSDGTATGTTVVKTFNAASDALSPANLINVNGLLYLTAYDSIHGVELWQSDGTEVGTVMVKDIRLGLGTSSPANLINADGTLYFTANDGVNGTELWVV